MDLFGFNTVPVSQHLPGILVVLHKHRRGNIGETNLLLVRANTGKQPCKRTLQDGKLNAVEPAVAQRCRTHLS